jgi:crotonobetainyl-CoA:carnitine CoA-transferase CaiB-like acyl-CoA transferase
VVVAVQHAGEWARFCDLVLERPDLIDHPDWATNSARVTHRPVVDALVEAVFGALTAEEAEARLSAADVAHARRRSVADLYDHPQLATTGRLGVVGTPAGEVLAPRPPFGRPDLVAATGAVPAAGQHTATVTAELDRAGSHQER